MLIIIFSLIIISSVVLTVFFILSREETQQIKTVNKVEAPKKPSLSAKVLAAEQLSQYTNESNDFDEKDIQGTPDKSMFPDIEKPEFLTVSKESKIKGSDTEQ